MGNPHLNPVIVIVEDDRTARTAMTAVLEAAGYHVIAVADGHQAYNIIRAGVVPRVILLDMLLPVLDGWHLMERFQANPGWAAIPVIMTTGCVLTADWAEDLGCAGFLKKPFEADSLLGEVERCLNPPSPGSRSSRY